MLQKKIIIAIITVLVTVQVAVFAFWIGQESQPLKGGSFGKTDDSSIFKGLGSLIPTWRKTIRCTRDVGEKGKKEEMISDGQSVLLSRTSTIKYYPLANSYYLYADGSLYSWFSNSGTYTPTSVDPNEPFRGTVIQKNCREEMRERGLDPLSIDQESLQRYRSVYTIFELIKIADTKADVDAMRTVYENNVDDAVTCETIGSYHFAPPSNVSFPVPDSCYIPLLPKNTKRQPNEPESPSPLPNETTPTVRPQPPAGSQNDF